MGNCAIVENTFYRNGENACKGKGGCGECAGPGTRARAGNGCEVPLREKHGRRRARLSEAQMKKSGKTFGAAPKAKSLRPQHKSRQKMAQRRRRVFQNRPVVETWSNQV